MNDPQRQMTPDTKLGTSNNSPKVGRPPKSQAARSTKIDPETARQLAAQVQEFEQQIHMAKIQGDEWVETEEAIINLFNKSGLNGAKYFIYKGIKVCKTGDLEAILDDESKSHEERMHPTRTPALDQGTPA